jgi:hypothetical protein
VHRAPPVLRPGAVMLPPAAPGAGGMPRKGGREIDLGGAGNCERTIRATDLNRHDAKEQART